MKAHHCALVARGIEVDQVQNEKRKRGETDDQQKTFAFASGFHAGSDSSHGGFVELPGQR